MPYDEEMEQELTLLDIFHIIWRRKWLIIFLTVIFGGGALFYALNAPLIYRSECRIFAPGGGGGGGLYSQLGGIADFIGLSKTATNAQMMLGVLKGDSVVDAIIDKFGMMEELQQDIRINARKSVLANLEAEEDTKSGIISIAYLHKDPQKAADIANSFVSELQKKLQDISVNDAQQRREFFENQLMQAQQELNMAEADLISYQQSRGVISFESQTGALLASINSLRNRIAAKNVEISTLRSYARNDNPRLRLAQSELDAMNKELSKLEEEQQKTDRRGRATSSDLFSSIGQVPELGVEYQKLMRTLRFATAKYEIMLRQYENARLGETNDLSTIMIIDPAKAPDYKYKPQRARIVLIGLMGGFFLGIFIAFLSNYINWLKKTQRDRYDYDDED